MAILQKGLLGVEDFYNGTDTSFTRANSTGGTSTLTKAVFGTGGGGDTSNPVAADRIRYAKAGGNDASNGLSWAAAKATLGAGLTDLTSGGVVYLAGNQTFASDPFSGITQDIHVVVLWGTLTCNVNVTVPANVTLEFRKQTLLQVATGVTVTINGILMAGNHRIFDLAGTGVVNPRNPTNGLLNVNWWGVRILDPNAAPAATGITASITAATNTASLSAASTFQNGDGVVIYGAGAAHALTTPAAPTVQPSVAAAATGTGLVVNAPAGGGETNNYRIVARTKNGGLTAAGTAGATAAGFTLGSRSVAITSLTRSNATVTVVTATAHELSVGAMVYITGTSDSTNFGGWFIVDTVADTTHFTFSNGLDTRQGGGASATGGTVFWFNCNRVSWTAVTGAWEYYIYGRGLAGSETLIGVSRPQGDTVTDLTWDDFGATMMGGIVLPPFVPSAPPGAATSDHLVSVIASGAGTTSLVLKDNAGTTVVAATIRYDIAPNVRIAATASALGTLYFPQTNISHRYVVNSYLNLASLTTLPVSQAGGLYLNETVELPSNTQWLGTVLPQPNGAPTFGWQPGSAIQVNSANPGFYQSGRNANSYFGLSFSSVGANGCLLFVGDRLNNATWDTCNFTTGTSTDYMGIGLMPRGTVNDTSFSLLLRRVTTSAGPSGSGGSSATPVIYFNRCGQTEIHSLQMSKRGVFFRFVASAADVSIDGGRMQGGIMPFLSCHHSGGVTNSSVAIKNYQIDTMAQAFVANMSDAEVSWSGAVSMEGNNDPSTDNGKSPGRVTGRPINGLIQKGVVVSSAGQLNGQNKNNVLALVGSATDGTLATNSAIRYLLQLINAGLGVGNAYSMFVQSTVPSAPTGVVAAGGSVPVADHTYKIVPVWRNGAEGILSAASATITTTPGNQTVNLSWTAVPGNPLGYNVYRDGALLLGTIPNTTTNSHSDTAGFVFGGSERTLPAGGPTYLNDTEVDGPLVRFNRAICHGTPLAASDIALSAGWGAGATVTAVTGTDQGFDFTVTAAGTPTANPTITPTFKDGTWTVAPIMSIMQRGGTGAPARIDYTPSATAPVITWGDTPVAGSTYIFSVICMGRTV